MVLQELGSFTVKEDRFLVSTSTRPYASETHQRPCYHPVMPSHCALPGDAAVRCSALRPKMDLRALWHLARAEESCDEGVC